LKRKSATDWKRRGERKKVNKLVKWSGVLFLLAVLAPSCAMFQASSAAKHPIADALDWPNYDRARVQGGGWEYSLPTETAGNVRLGDLWTIGVVQQRDAFWQRVLRDRCIMREVLQVANGEKPKPDGICQPIKE